MTEEALYYEARAAQLGERFKREGKSIREIGDVAKAPG